MKTTGVRQRSAWILAASLSCGCVLDTAGKDACRTSADCVNDGTCWHGRCLSDPTWGCLGLGQPEEIDGLAVRLSVLDGSTDLPIAGATVRLCPRADTLCEQPRSVTTTDDAGAVLLTLADEYLELQAPGYRNHLAAGMTSLEVTTAGVSPLEVHFDLYTSAGFAALEADTGVVPDGQRGDVEVLVRDCLYESAAGAHVQLDGIDAGTNLRYLVADLPSTDATETDLASGSALYFNVPPGLHSAAAEVFATGAPVGGPGAGEAVLVRAGWVSHVAITPPGVLITDSGGD